MFSPTHLQTFLVVAQTHSFTQAAERLRLRQSTVSQHIRKLEDAAGRRLFIRDTHSVATTPDGEAMIEMARGILSANDRAQRYFAASQLRGRLRFGTSEDFVTSRLPDVLRDFVHTHPLVEFELTVARSAQLNEKLGRGELDLICGKRPPGDKRGRVVSRDRLAWVSANGYLLPAAGAVPLILFSPPSIMRDIALAALQGSSCAWRIVCTSDSLSGVRAATLAGLGVTVVSEGLIPAGLIKIPGGHGLPDLGVAEFVVMGSENSMRGPAAELADVILASGIRV